MIVDLPDTTTSAVSKALVKIREEGGAVALGRVLTLVIATPLGEEEEAIEAANDASREHPMRVIVLSKNPDPTVEEKPRLDAEIRVGGDAGASEVIVLRAYGPTASDEEGLVTSLLLPDAPVVVWWPSHGPAEPSTSPLGKIAQRRITDAAEAPNPVQALINLGKHYAPGDTDFAWTRLTLWRAQLAAVLDQPPFEPVTAVAVSGSSDSPSTELLAAWLQLALQVPVMMEITSPVHGSSGIHGVRLERESGVIDLERVTPAVATLVQPNQPTHDISLPRRNLRDCLAEELRRLDPDDLFGEVVQRGVPQLPVPAPRATKSGSRAKTGSKPAKSRIVSNERRVLVHPDKQTLAGSVAARFITKIVDVLDDLGEANVCLTGGTMGAAVLAAINDSPARDSVDWSRITFWWGDERYLPMGDPDRNDTQSRAALLDHLTLDAAQIKSLPAPGDQPDIEQAARYYERELADAADDDGRYPRFDITFLGVGPDGHIASLFPDHAAVRETERVVVAETDSPKPPPERLSLTLPVINSSDRIWLVLAGSDKASALGLALAGASINDVPAAGAEGRKRTVFFVDQDAAAEVPENLIAPSYYWTSADDNSE